MRTKFPANALVLWVVSNEGLRVNSATYIKVLEAVVNPWIDRVRIGRHYISAHSAPLCKAQSKGGMDG